MIENFVLSDVNQALRVLTYHIMARGLRDESRAGVTRELLHVGVTLTNPLHRETTNPERKGSLAAQIAETMWVLSGRNDVKWLSHYLPRAEDFSDDGKTWRGAYGKRIRGWDRRDNSEDFIDQLAWVINLLKTDPGTRRAVVSIFDPVTDQASGKDIPCNDLLDFKIRDGLLHLHVFIRSNDLIWGWSGINQFEWSVLQEIVAGMVGVRVGVLSFSISSLHIYEQHWERATKIQGTRGTRGQRPGCPRFEFSGDVDKLDSLFSKWFLVERMIRQGSQVDNILSAINDFPEPMLQSWLRVIAWWWSGQESYLKPLDGTDLYLSAMAGVQPKRGEADVARPVAETASTGGPTDFAKFVSKLHETKHASYGDSWKRRGEKVAIQANIARKVDRLGKTDDLETAADTAIDLLVYLIKYRWWLFDQGRMGSPFATFNAERFMEVSRVRLHLERLDMYSGWESNKDYEVRLKEKFELLLKETAIPAEEKKTAQIMNAMIQDANSLARREYWRANNEKRAWAGYGDAE